MKYLKCVLVLLVISGAIAQELANSDEGKYDSGEEFIPPKTHEENDGDDVKTSEADDTPEEKSTSTKNIPNNEDITETVALPVGTEGAKQKSRMSGRLMVDYNNWDSLKSAYAPQQQSQLGNGLPYVITEARLKEIRKEFMYWYWDMGGDSENNGDFQTVIQQSTPTIHKNLNFQLPFFGFRYNYTRVSLNGYLEFSDPPQNYAGYPLVFPVKDWPKKNDPAFIGIFHSRCRIGATRTEDVDQRRPGVYYRMERDLMARTDQLGVEVRERIKWDIREGVIGADSFNPKHAIIITWKNVTFAGGISQSLYTTNTFQMVLATDEVFTYAIFNYKDLQWSSHTEAGGDTLKGEGGIPAYVGFNAGNGTRSHEYKPYSQNSIIRDLTSRGWANNMPGRHIFRIDETVMLGSCNKDIDDANLPLFLAPESGNMLGGTVVNITGPCFEPTDIVSCKFDVVADEVRGTVVDRNRAICIQPRLFVEGYINLEISVGIEKYKWKGKYFVEPPASATEKIFFDQGRMNEKYPSEIKMSWVKQNLTTNENAPVRISLWGYRERTIRPEFVYIDLLADGITNTGEYTISPSSYRNRDNVLFTDIKFGFIQINLTDSIQVGDSRDVQVTPVIWSRPIPLAWYFAPQWEREHGTNWPKKLCDLWIKNDRYLKNFAHELPQCPCSLEHALNDKGRFLPDFDCDKDTNPRCQFNKGSVHCVRSGAPTLEGSEQQCCYDKNSDLMLSYDQLWGSTPRRSHNLGYLPWDEANKVPTLSQWFHDIIPKYMCCMWQDDSSTGESGEQSVGCETLRFERRPTQDCVAYQPPEVAGVFGDPHIVTFDNYEYTFNGLGEFALVKTQNKDLRLDVQGRFEQMPMNAYGEVRATQLTGITARGNSSTVIEVRTRPEEARWRYRLEVLANGKRVYFDRPSLKFQHFPGVLVYTPTYILNQSEVIMMFDSGAGVEVVENRGYMTARVYLPWKFINQTRGLFGNWSFDAQDDLVTPDGQRVPITTNINDFQSIYNDFGKKWMLEDKEDPEVGKSLFYRENGKTSSNYNNKTFLPNFVMNIQEFIPPNRSIEIQKAEDLCHEYYQCRYDYAMTLDQHLAHFSLNYHSSIKNVKELNKKQVVSCGILETPRFGRKSNFKFVPGTKVTFECNEGFILDGDQRRECTSNGRWDLPKYGYTECLRLQEFSSRNAGITTAIVLSVIVTLVVILAYIGYRLIKKRRKDNEAYGAHGDGDGDERMRAQEFAASRLRASPPDDYYDDESTIPSVKKIPIDSDTTERSLSPPKEYRTISPPRENRNVSPSGDIRSLSPSKETDIN